MTEAELYEQDQKICDAYDKLMAMTKSLIPKFTPKITISDESDITTSIEIIEYTIDAKVIDHRKNFSIEDWSKAYSNWVSGKINHYEDVLPNNIMKMKQNAFTSYNNFNI